MTQARETLNSTHKPVELCDHGRCVAHHPDVKRGDGLDGAKGDEHHLKGRWVGGGGGWIGGGRSGRGGAKD